MVELPLLVPEMRVQIQARTLDLSDFTLPKGPFTINKGINKTGIFCRQKGEGRSENFPNLTPKVFLHTVKKGSCPTMD